MTRHALMIGLAVMAVACAEPGATPPPATHSEVEDEQAVATVLDALHANAASGSLDAYFNLFTADAIFVGTDASEVWTMAQFRQYAEPHFADGEGWTFTVSERDIAFAPNGDVAWFLEEPESASYGVTRGSGVLIKTNDGWKISQYVLSFPIPNEAVGNVLNVISNDQ